MEEKHTCLVLHVQQIPLNGFITCHLFCHFPLVFIYFYKNSGYIYMQQTSFYRNESNIIAKGTLFLYERYDQKYHVRKVGMQDCSCPLNNPFYKSNKLTKETEHASSQAQFYCSPMKHPPTLFLLHFFAASDCRRI